MALTFDLRGIGCGFHGSSNCGGESFIEWLVQGVLRRLALHSALDSGSSRSFIKLVGEPCSILA